MKKRLLLVLVPMAVLVAAFTGCGLTASSLNPGYAHFDTPRQPGLKRDTVLSLGPAVLRLAARYVDDDPETQALLRTLDGVRVAVYQLDAGADRASLGLDLAASARHLEDDNWLPVVMVNEHDSQVHILTRGDDKQLFGLAILAVDREELVYVNVMGDIAAEQLAQIATALPVSDDSAFRAMNLGTAGAE